MEDAGEVCVVVEVGGLEEVRLLQAERRGEAAQEGPDVLEAEELRHLRPLVHLLHVDGGGVEGVGHVAQQHAVPEAKGNKFEI